MTPLMWVAINNANAEIITALVSAGADVNAKNKDGKTVLKFAEDNKSENKSEIMALLREAVSGDIEVVPQGRDDNEE
ncbi:MAG: hypothetical protein LBS53_07270 [Synergistaceae bacterium]|jgi:ankyrin repeat protein|nr:hypothetical protein [Synergistaceae bacterium]